MANHPPARSPPPLRNLLASPGLPRLSSRRSASRRSPYPSGGNDLPRLPYCAIAYTYPEPSGRRSREAAHPGRVLCPSRLSSQVCDPAAERSAAIAEACVPTGVYVPARTPFQRVLASRGADAQRVAELQRRRETLDLFQLCATIWAKLERLFALGAEAVRGVKSLVSAVRRGNQRWPRMRKARPVKSAAYSATISERREHSVPPAGGQAVDRGRPAARNQCETVT
jgi:hypothetical protein